MLYLILSILFSVLLLVNFRIFPTYGINTWQAICLNYIVCFLTGLVLLPHGQKFMLDLSQNWTWYCLLLGLGFIITFILSGLSTQKSGILPTSLANNLSLIIPVGVSLGILHTSAKVFDLSNYTGILLALIAIALITFNKKQAADADYTYWYLPLGVFVFYGITNTAINVLNLYYIPNPELTIPVTLIMVLGAAISGLVVLTFRGLKHKEPLLLKNMVAAVSLGIPNFLSFYMLLLALSSFGNDGAFVYPFYNIGLIVISTLVAVLFFKEKLSKVNTWGLILGICSLLLLSHQELNLW